jgi:hypothetical protein
MARRKGLLDSAFDHLDGAFDQLDKTFDRIFGSNEPTEPTTVRVKLTPEHLKLMAAGNTLCFKADDIVVKVSS